MRRRFDTRISKRPFKRNAPEYTTAETAKGTISAISKGIGSHSASPKSHEVDISPSHPPRSRQSVQFTLNKPELGNNGIPFHSHMSHQSIESCTRQSTIDHQACVSEAMSEEAIISSRSASRYSTLLSQVSTVNGDDPQEQNISQADRPATYSTELTRPQGRRVSLRLVAMAPCEDNSPVSQLSFTPRRQHYASASSQLFVIPRHKKKPTQYSYSPLSYRSGAQSVRSSKSPYNTLTTPNTRAFAYEHRGSRWNFPLCMARPAASHKGAHDVGSEISISLSSARKSLASLSRHDSDLSNCPSLFQITARNKAHTYDSMAETRRAIGFRGKLPLHRTSSIRIGMVTRPSPTAQGKAGDSISSPCAASRLSQSLLKTVSPELVSQPKVIMPEAVLIPYHRRKCKFPPSNYRPEYMRGAPVTTLSQGSGLSRGRNDTGVSVPKPPQRHFISGLYGIGRFASGLQQSEDMAPGPPQPSSAEMPRPLSNEEKLSLMMHHKNAMGIRLERRQEIAARILAKDDEETTGVLRSCRMRRSGEIIDSPRRLQQAFRPALQAFRSNYGSERYLPLKVAPELSNWSRLVRKSTRTTEEDEIRDVEVFPVRMTTLPVKRSPSSASTRASSSGSNGQKKRSATNFLEQCWCLEFRNSHSLAVLEHQKTSEGNCDTTSLPRVTLTPAEFSAFESGCFLRPPHPITLETIRASEWLLFSDGIYIMFLLARSWSRYEPNYSLSFYAKRKDGLPWVGKQRSVLNKIFTEKTQLGDLHETTLQDLTLSISHLNLHQLTFLRRQLPAGASYSGREELRSFAERLDNCITESVCSLILDRDGFLIGGSIFHRLQSSLIKNRPIDLTSPSNVGETGTHTFYPRPNIGAAQAPKSSHYAVPGSLSRLSSRGCASFFDVGLSYEMSMNEDQIYSDQRVFIRSMESDLGSDHMTQRQLRQAFTKWERQGIGRRVVTMFGSLMRLSRSLHKFIRSDTPLEKLDLGEPLIETWWYVPIADIVSETSQVEASKGVQAIGSLPPLGSRDMPSKLIAGKPRYLFVKFPTLALSCVRPAEQALYSLRTPSVTNRDTAALQYWDLRELPAAGEIKSLEPSPSVSTALKELLTSSLFLRLQARQSQLKEAQQVAKNELEKANFESQDRVHQQIASQAAWI